MRRPTILICDDEEELRGLLTFALTDKGYKVLGCDEIGKALSMLHQERVDILITDLLIGKENGIELIKMMKKNSIMIPAIVLTAYGSVQSAVQAMTEGAFYYLLKPINYDELFAVLEKAEEKINLEHQNIYLKEELSKLRDVSEMVVAESPMMHHLLDEAKKVAATDSTVIIQGESGTGKEVIATFVHRNSKRAEKALVVVNCAAISEHLLESELFGHERGAFTGAIKMKQGKFEVADGGTIFLDEIGEMPLPLQAKLLRVLENGEIDRVGSVNRIFVDVRVIAATNCDLKKAVTNGTFREDLYYRLTVLPLKVPALRERSTDVRPLATLFLTLNERIHGTKVRVDEDVFERLERYRWPGNVRELKNLIERLTILHEHITTSVLPDEFNASPSPGAVREAQLPLAGKTLCDIERDAIRQALIASGGNKQKAADVLDITRQTLYAKIKEYGIARE
ncbi:MAG: sigma-54-dependent Fis family transcriptional regulator [Spirochaetes bacterium]|nr:sigma-54-dependent Fis family transcriptional regulator [Spirochaetota bacterium]